MGGLLNQRGFAVLVPERRGYGDSEGTTYSEEVGNDTGALFIRRLEAETDDVLAALSYLKTLPWVDQNRLGIMGWSFGGIISMFAAARSDRFRVVVDQAGGALTWPYSGALQKALKDAAKQVKAPVLLMAARNDRTTDSVTTLARIMADRQAPHKLIVYDPFHPSGKASDIAPGHLIFSLQGYPVWQEDVGRFFAEYLNAH